MNELDRVKGKVIDIKSYDYRLLTLHARIDFMENLSHIRGEKNLTIIVG